MHVSSLLRTASRFFAVSDTARRCRLRYANRRTRSSLALPSSGLAALSSRAISDSMASFAPVEALRA